MKKSSWTFNGHVPMMMHAIIRIIYITKKWSGISPLWWNSHIFVCIWYFKEVWRGLLSQQPKKPLPLFLISLFLAHIIRNSIPKAVNFPKVNISTSIKQIPKVRKKSSFPFFFFLSHLLPHNLASLEDLLYHNSNSFFIISIKAYLLSLLSQRQWLPGTCSPYSNSFQH